VSEGIEVPGEKNGNGDKGKLEMEPALVLLINNETGMFEWQDIPAPEGKGVKTGGSWEFKILCAAVTELQGRILGLAQMLWQKKIRSFGLVGGGIQKGDPNLLKKLDERGMKRR
jgi:hypothetical protein